MAVLLAQAAFIIFVLVTLLWIGSVTIKNVSIVDIFWGFGFVVVNTFYVFMSGELNPRKLLLLVLVGIWGLRLSIYLAWRNIGKEEDFRYQEFRRYYGPKRYWWFSYFQVFLLQGGLLVLISLPFLGVSDSRTSGSLYVIDYIGIVLWLIGFIFEAGGDFQLARFKRDRKNKGKVLRTGLWKYTRHPNYFGDAAVWWGYAIFSIAAENYWPIIGSVIMTVLIVKVSGVSLLERTLKEAKPEYLDYIEKTNSFFPWFPKK